MVGAYVRVPDAPIFRFVRSVERPALLTFLLTRLFIGGFVRARNVTRSPDIEIKSYPRYRRQCVGRRVSSFTSVSPRCTRSEFFRKTATTMMRRVAEILAGQVTNPSSFLCSFLGSPIAPFVSPAVPTHARTQAQSHARSFPLSSSFQLAPFSTYLFPFALFTRPGLASRSSRHKRE